MISPAQAPAWLREALRALENKFREVMPAPFRLKSYATADLPDAADFLGGLVYDSTTATPKISTGSAWSAIDSGTTTSAVTFNNGGAGAASGTTFNGSAARTISHNTIGALALTGGTLTGPLTGTTATFGGGSGALTPFTAYGEAASQGYSVKIDTATGQFTVETADGSVGIDFKALFTSGSQYRFYPNNTLALTITSTAVSPVSSTTASAANVHQASSGSAILRSTSSIRYKENVETLTDARADALLQLRPVTYNSKADADEASWKYIGFIAEEVAAIEPRLVHWVLIPEGYEIAVDPAWPKDADGTQLVPDAVQYDRLPVFMLSVIKRARATLINERQKNAEQDKRIKALEDRLLAAGIV